MFSVIIPYWVLLIIDVDLEVEVKWLEIKMVL